MTRTEQALKIDAPYMIHDLVIIARFIVLLICPARFDLSGGQMGPQRWLSSDVRIVRLGS